jgi:tRNA dimethylallyltransferase
LILAPAAPTPPLIVVVGPTAAGKSDLALELAQALGGEVVSADSVQVYRGFDIGTGKLLPHQRRGVPHHLLDVLDPGEPFSAARFVELADEAIAGIRGRGRQVVLAGGTGLYVRALLRGLFSAPPADPGIRQEHRRLARQNGSASLHARLAGVDPEAAARIDPADLVRISRALEVHQQTGRTISSLHAEHAHRPPRYPALLLGINPPRGRLWRRIERRVQGMAEAGWLDEVRALLAAGHGDSHPMGSLGYRQLRAHLQGELDLQEALRQTVRDTRRFARRQIAWFSSEPGVRWFERGGEVSADQVRGWLDARRADRR